ncbi:MAG: Trk system potassium transporter TrkA [Kiritimatiellae bacterium]|nr:Trk system potassium transporter TrkA [Kiritimatiellia bacterium]MDD4737216.1 Trk system potassium transporter TrkA [Kiritimatiellia bacterium]
MKIIIVGAGEAGQQLAERLCEQKHEVTIIDQESEALEHGEAQFDVMTLHGSGSSPRILADAQVSKADILVAVTGSDEANILACLYAHAAGVPHKLARVANRDYLLENTPFDLKKAGVDRLVCPQEENAREMMSMLQAPGLEHMIDLFAGSLYAIGIELSTQSEMVGRALKTCSDNELISAMRILAIRRGDKVFVPTGETVFEARDRLFVAIQSKFLQEVQDWIMPARKRISKVIVAGGGVFGLYLTELLEDSFKQVVLIERDEARAEYCSGVLNKALVLRGDVLEQEVMQNAGVNDETAFVAVTSDDEDNIIACLLARKLGCSFTLTQIRKPEYVPVVEQLDLIDRVVNPNVAMTTAVLGFIRGENVRAAKALKNLPGEFLDVVIQPGSKWSGQEIHALGMSSGTVIAAVLREEDVLVPVGSLQLLPDDHLILFALDDCVSKLKSFFKD